MYHSVPEREKGWRARPPAMEEVIQRLAEVSIRQQQTMEHLATRQGRTEEEVATARATAAHRVPLPDPRAQAARLLPKMTADDDVEAFLQVFESTAQREVWPQEDWAHALAPLLTGEAQRAYFSLPLAIAENYVEVKREILARLGLSPICAAQQFHEWQFKLQGPTGLRQCGHPHPGAAVRFPKRPEKFLTRYLCARRHSPSTSP